MSIPYQRESPPATPEALEAPSACLLMLEGDRKMKEATRLYQQAAGTKPMDATERLDIELAKAELDE